MTASELIQQLQDLPPDMKIVIRGYEEGYNDILKIRKVRIKPAKNAPWYLGEYNDSTDEDAMEAVDLFGENKNTKVDYE